MKTTSASEGTYMSEDAELTAEPGTTGQMGTPPAVATNERSSAAGAQAVIERLLPHSTGRNAILAFFAQSITIAHTAQPAAWGVTLYRDRVRLNVNQVIVCTLVRDTIWIAVDKQALDEPTTARLSQLQDWQEHTYRSVPTSASATVHYHELEEVLPLLASAHARLIQLCAARSAQAPLKVQGAHSEGVIAYLRAAGFPDVPSPAYDGGIPDVDSALIEQAFSTFDQAYRDTAEWRNWERDPKFVYFIERDGVHYPVKEILRIATGATQFDSRQARAYLTRRGYTIDSRAQTPSRAWLFQANPQYYDLADRLRQAKIGDEDVWTVNRYGDRMRAGDPVLLWLSGEEAGIYAVGELLGPPVEQTYAPGEAPAWITRENADQAITVNQVPFRYTQILAEPLKRTSLLAHPVISQMQVVVAPPGTNFAVTAEEWQALQELLPAADGSQRAALTTPEGRRAAFTRFRAEPANRFLVTVRRARAQQLRDLLAEPDSLTLEGFNREVWQIESATILDGQTLQPGITTDNHVPEAEELERLESALQDERLELHGNYIWRTASQMYHPHSKDNAAKLADIQRVAAILTDASLPPLEKARRVDAIPGFGENTATGLVMVFHPDTFALYNRQSREGLQKLGIVVGDLGDFQEQVARLRSEVEAEDFLELDTFLYRVNQEIATSREPQIWWVNQGQSFVDEQAQGFLWAPLQDKGGKAPAHWKTMREVRPGDVVVHYSDWGLTAVSRVTVAAVEAPRPGATDGPIGRLVMTEYWELNPPQSYGWSGLELSPMIPGGGPFDKNGNVRQGYLWRFSRDALYRLREDVDSDWPQWVDDLLDYEPKVIPPIEPQGSQEQGTSPARTFGGLLTALHTAGLTFPVELVSQYLLALQAKRFVIFTGISGTGKTQLAMAVAAYYAEDQQTNRAVVAVRPDWTDQRGLLGFYNPLTRAYVTTPFLRFLLDAAAEVGLARREQRAPRPFFVVLDEMNLARVEYYFADFLSSLESGEALALHDDETLEAVGADGAQVAVPRRLHIPANLFFTGTVNVDETTSMFSPKVLDRAFTVEFNHVDLGGFGALPGSNSAEIEPLFLSSLPTSLLAAAPATATPKDAAWKAFRELDGGALSQFVEALHRILEAEGRHFGYRVANEIARFVTLAHAQAGQVEAARLAALDLAILTKVLPKLNGTQQELSELLVQLFDLAVHGVTATPAITTEAAVLKDWRVIRGQIAPVAPGSTTAAPRLPRTAAKLWVMLRRLRQQGFASFIV